MEEKKVVAKAVKQIYETKEYDKFKLASANRPISRLHVENLKRSMKENYFFDPIQVDKKGEIIDGQHRYTAVKELGLPLRYYVDRKYSTVNVASMNNLTKKWTHSDYATSYSIQGNKNYELYKQFRSAYPSISHGVALALLSGGTDRSMATEKRYNSGQFEVKDYKKAVETAERLAEINKAYPQTNKSQFAFAALQVLAIPEVNYKTLFHKISKKSELLRDYSQTKDYVKALEEIYNWNNSKKLRFY